MGEDGLPIMNNSITDSEFSRRKRARRNVGERDGDEVGMKKSGLRQKEDKRERESLNGRRKSQVEELVV